MSSTDDELFSSMVRIENKDLFVDLRRNKNGVFLKLSERSGTQRRSVLIPASGIKKLQQVLDDVIQAQDESKATSAGAATIADVDSSDDPIETNSVFVNDLSWNTDEEGLAAHFASAGQVSKAVIMRKQRRGKLISLGCGVVEFSTVEDAANAIKTLNGTVLDERTIKCRADRKSASSTTEGEPVATEFATKPRVAVPTQVYVNNLSWATTSDDLASYFGRAGNVKHAEVRKSKSGRSLGHGIVEFVDAAAAASAIANLDKTELDGRELAVREYYEK